MIKNQSSTTPQMLIVQSEFRAEAAAAVDKQPQHIQQVHELPPRKVAEATSVLPGTNTHKKH